MLDTTIHAKTIARQFRRSDFRDSSWGITADDKDEIIADALRVAATGFTTVSLRRNSIGGKPVYRHAALCEALLIRHISEGLRRITGVQQSDRKSIVKSLIALTSEGVPFNILKFDIKSFYESVDTDALIERLRRDPAFSRQSIGLIETFFAALQSQRINGLPRGIGLSATLSEYLLRAFDSAISNFPGVRFYSRYVDDGIILASDKVDASQLLDFVKGLLPIGLELNRAKTKPYKFGSFLRSAGSTTEHSIKFLGYTLDISHITRTNGRLCRNVHVDIAHSKVAKIKRRICLSLLNFNNGGNFNDLHNRIKLLTSNYGFVDDSTGQQRYSGIKYNYGLIDPTNSPQLAALDRFLINVVTSSHPNNRIRPNLTRVQRARILGFGFTSGFLANRFFTFDEVTLKNLIGCWSHA
ncbi:Reverse transcriptase (RNA-dependent DNA polymerase) [Sphingobium sp. YR657]|uniref:antiviral reverse transcriptase Drt3a n=1 Tax=unclassified Sphingobium TaxID=2611147 RepID=UPI000914E010|nr:MULTISPECIES: antiviral reverse transcriptase Drt3a [unclassified Sphingobium]SHM72985.1 Reverse transcriptase (RNA-dependent DNA polymerase) [Sphingobium sp. YR657]